MRRLVGILGRYQYRSTETPWRCPCLLDTLQKHGPGHLMDWLKDSAEGVYKLVLLASSPSLLSILNLLCLKIADEAANDVSLRYLPKSPWERIMERVELTLVLSNR
jgi:hypothetical protein